MFSSMPGIDEQWRIEIELSSNLLKFIKFSCKALFLFSCLLLNLSKQCLVESKPTKNFPSKLASVTLKLEQINSKQFSKVSCLDANYNSSKSDFNALSKTYPDSLTPIYKTGFFIEEYQKGRVCIRYKESFPFYISSKNYFAIVLFKNIVA